jgi:DNA modification methylase
MKDMGDNSVDCVVTDPPYGVGIEYNQFKDTEQNVLELAKAWIPLSRRIAHRTVFTSGVKQMYLYPPPDWVLCWYCPAGTGMGPWGFTTWQPILCYGKDPYLQNRMGSRPDAFQTSSESTKEIDHPCPKTNRVMSKIIQRTSLPNHTVLDPFMGSGTTGVACVNLGRKFIGIEIDPDYFEIACRRIEEAYQQPRLFEDVQSEPEQREML